MTLEACPLCRETLQGHRLRATLCPEISCGCKNCYWCGHQIPMVTWAIDLDHADALEMNYAAH
jgi:hypothetical protein